ncbi:MAG: hypothetical protein WCI51_07100, partial [Lentisphaerota bacterium]
WLRCIFWLRLCRAKNSVVKKGCSVWFSVSARGVSKMRGTGVQNVQHLREQMNADETREYRNTL